MSIILCRKAESFIADLKWSVDTIWNNYGNEIALDSLIYADREYGNMQRGELKEIVTLLGYLKKQVDGLSEDCEDIPMEARGPGEVWQKIS